MKHVTLIGIFVASMLAFTSLTLLAGQGKGGGAASASGAQQVDRDRTQDRDSMQDRTRLEVPDRDRDRQMDKDMDRDRDKLQQPGPASLQDKDIYGRNLMTNEEVKQYRKALQAAGTTQAREAVQARHEKQMRERALQEGEDLVPPGQGPVYGGEFMTVKERNEYREKLRLFESDDERMQFQAQHRERMDQRAAVLEAEVEEAE